MFENIWDMKYRILNILLAAVALCLVGCNGGSGDEPTSSSSAPTVSPTSVSFTADGGTATIEYDADAKPSLVSSADWCTTGDNSFSNGSGKFTVTASANSTTNVRYASVSVVCNGKKATVTVTQEAGTGSSGTSTSTEVVVTKRNPTSSLSNSKASAKAKSLYKYLLSIYGSKTISGAMGGTAWESGYTDYIYSQAGAGKYPGIVGFDYIFLNWPANAWSGAPDYGDISPVQTAYNNGNIIQIGWHWTVPSSESGFVDVTADGFTLSSDNQKKLNAYSYNTKAFSVEQALTSGTWQNNVITYQIKRLAGYMQLLKDANIPVLFRPLHEAAGDYTWGAWFWWGYEGADAYKKLWIYLYDQLTNVYGLDNLIWVFTVQTSNAGSIASVDTIKEWYPGDEYVDIVGADLYVKKNTTQADAFNQVNSSVGGAKMVTLSEFGNLLDIDGYFNADTPWLYFMNWCNSENSSWVLYCKASDGTYTWNNSASDWKSALNNSHTLNRGDFNY